MRYIISLILLACLVMNGNAHAAEIKPLILKVNQGEIITLDKPATSVFIANPEIADVQVMSPTNVMVFGKTSGTTTLSASDQRGKTIITRTIQVSHNVGELDENLKALWPNHRVTFSSVPNGIIIDGEALDPALIADAKRIAERHVGKEGQIIAKVRLIKSNQIHLRVRVAEVNREIDRRFGINWNVLARGMGAFTWGIATGAVIGTGNNIIGTRPNSANVAGVNYNKNGKDVNALVDALSEDGFVTMLAEPNLTAMSGETASFLVGGEVPIVVPQNGNSFTYEYKPYGISVAFTPTLVNDDRINVHVRPEVSELSDLGAVTINNVRLPSFNTRRAETTVELGSGQSFAIAGLINNRQEQTVNKYPFLGDVPVLGALFRSTRFQNNQSELVIIVTPYIVRPTTEERIALPTDGIQLPSEVDRLLRLRLTGLWGSHIMSGTPRAVFVPGPPPAATQINEPLSTPVPADAPAPAAAPITPVIKDEKSQGASGKLMTSPPALLTAGLSFMGPGGYVLE
jgi:pilus assembly protein CpaC